MTCNKRSEFLVKEIKPWTIHWLYAFNIVCCFGNTSFYFHPPVSRILLSEWDKSLNHCWCAFYIPIIIIILQKDSCITNPKNSNMSIHNTRNYVIHTDNQSWYLQMFQLDLISVTETKGVKIKKIESTFLIQESKIYLQPFVRSCELIGCKPATCILL